jgi:hypothetical protein
MLYGNVYYIYIVYKIQNYTDVIRKCADMSMSRAVEEIKVSQIYGVIGGEVCICMHACDLLSLNYCI